MSAPTSEPCRVRAADAIRWLANTFDTHQGLVMSDITIWHNPRCSKSRKTLELIRDRGFEPEIVEYLKTPPTASEIDAALQALGAEPRALIRTKEAPYRELGLDDSGMSRAALIAAMVEHPSLIERPLVLRGGRAAIGRPPEKVLELLEA